MKLITNRTIHTPWKAHYARAAAAKNPAVMTVEYFDIAKQRIAHVELPARIMEASAYEKMVKLPDTTKPKGSPDDPHKRKEAHKKRTDLEKGKNLTKGEKEAFKDVETAIENPQGSDGREDDEYLEFEVDVKKAAEPKAKQYNFEELKVKSLNEDLRKADLDDLYTAGQIREAIAGISEFDDEEARKRFMDLLGEPIANKSDLKDEFEETEEF